MRNSEVLNASPFRHALRPLPDKAVSHALRSSGQNNGDIGDVLRAAAKPGSAIDADGWLPKPRHDGRPKVPAHRLRAYQPAHPVKLSRMARKRA